MNEVEGDGEHCELVSCKMVEQLLWSFMWKPRRAVPLGVSGATVYCRQTLKAQLTSAAFAANLSHPVHYCRYYFMSETPRENTPQSTKILTVIAI